MPSTVIGVNTLDGSVISYEKSFEKPSRLMSFLRLKPSYRMEKAIIENALAIMHRKHCIEAEEARDRDMAFERSMLQIQAGVEANKARLEELESQNSTLKLSLFHIEDCVEKCLNRFDECHPIG